VKNDFTGREAQLVPGTLRGYRCWLPDNRISGALRSIGVDYRWEGPEVTATCHATYWPGLIGARDRHPAPSPVSTCTCGVYARHLPAPVVSPFAVEGVIEAWGTVEVGVLGFRAGKARIVALGMPECVRPSGFAEFMRFLGPRYYPVKFFPTNDAMWAEYPPIDVSELIAPLIEAGDTPVWTDSLHISPEEIT
jgi:hypothetical protein